MMSYKPYNQEFFSRMAKDFETHIAQSIPLYELYLNTLAKCIVRYSKTASVLDIGGSCGTLGKMLYLNGFKGTYVNIEIDSNMCQVSRNNLLTANLSTGRFNKYETLQRSFREPCFVNKEKIEAFSMNDVSYLNHDKKFDFVVENLVFQFFTKTRKPEIEYIKKCLLKPNGAFVTFEKFLCNDVLFNINEELKSLNWKDFFFSEEEIQEKKATVLDKMDEYLFNISDFVCLLDNPACLLTIGNFIGFIDTFNNRIMSDFLIEFSYIDTNLFNHEKV